MTQQVSGPYVHVEDSNGNPYYNAYLYVYAPGTTTPASVYTNAALSIAATNPARSDAAGNFPRLYIAAGTYKLRAETSAAVLIWEEDNIDTGLQAATGALPITRGGTGATTAAAARANLDVPSNSELTALSSSITTIQTTVQGITPIPGGRLTMTSATPVIASDVSAGTALYYTPHTSTICPVYDGAAFNAKVFAELTLTLNASHLANIIYDIFIINDSSTIRVVTGPGWNTSTAGAGARGTGAGTTELVRVNGIWTNKFAMTARNGATTYSVNASCGTYVGSMAMDGTNGQLTCLVGYGQSRKFGLWNAYNRKPIIQKCGDATSTWTYNTGTIRQSRADATNFITIFTGLAEETFDLQINQNLNIQTNTQLAFLGLGYNSTTVFSGFVGLGGGTNGTLAHYAMIGRYIAPPALGINAINSLEKGGGSADNIWRGGEDDHLMLARYLG